MINGAHSIIFSSDPDADRAFLRDVLGLPHVDVGEGWLIFGLPPSEVAIHPGDENDMHQLYLMTHDVEALLETMALRGVETTDVQDQGWGLVTQVTLPGGGKLPIYQPRHDRPEQPSAGMRAKRRASKKKAAKTKAGKKKVSNAPKVGKRAPAKAKKAAKKKR